MKIYICYCFLQPRDPFEDEDEEIPCSQVVRKVPSPLRENFVKGMFQPNSFGQNNVFNFTMNFN